MSMQPVCASQGRYIKLGEAGEWANLCIVDGTLRLGYYEVAHEAALSGDVEVIRKAYADRGGAVATRYANEVISFYREPPETLWVTFSGDWLYWCNSIPTVEFFGSDKAKYPQGSRLRRTVSGWQNTDVQGRPLLKRDLPGSVTSTAAYRGTICKYNELERLLEIINCRKRPVVDAAQNAQSQAIDALKPLITDLHPKDLELLVELVFAQSGYRRQSITGGAQKMLDIALELPITGETAFVQVKTKTDQQQLDRYVSEHAGGSFDRMFYIYHTSPIRLHATASNVTILDLDDLSAQVVKAGLFDWVVKKAA